ncbi:hypothetical protein HPULCUR_003623 [Helicostylum pulchrum]|uniref:Uncharacterized protein n=1 Tax=Helicostylum pulchrum TaxID=562976 RepID=A0ABP9XTY4_9FUNG
MQNIQFTHVIGIGADMCLDLGAKFSSAGYCIKEDGFEKVTDIRWDLDYSSSDFPKVPTAIAYHRTDPRKLKWGLSAVNMTEDEKEEYEEVIELFKLHLDEDFMNNPGEVPTLPDGTSALTIISDYLKELHKCICEEMRLSMDDDQDFNSKKELFQYCLTVPSKWSTNARNNMIRASILAGIISREDPPERLIIISDLEAAILYTELSPDGIHAESGESILVCDIGGSSVDIAVFTKYVEGSKRILVETTPRYFKYNCVSDELDARMAESLNRNATPYGFDQGKKEAMSQEFLKNFTTEFKSVFGSDLTFLDNRYDVSTGYFTSGIEEFVIPPSMIHEQVFEPVISEIVDVMDYQIGELNERGSNLDYIVLTGGFIPNFYLVKSIKERFGDKVKEIVSPPKGASLTLSRGATYSVLLDPYDEVLVMDAETRVVNNLVEYNKRRFVTIGIDLGTLFSTASYALTGEDKQADDVHDITKWPKNRLHLSSKVPSAIRYHLTDPTIYKCGYEALLMSDTEKEEYGEVIQQFKLYLDEDKYHDTIEPLPEGLTILKVFSDYLTSMYSNICTQIKHSSNYRSEGIMQRKFLYCLTVPATYSNKSKAILREACIRADMISRYDHFDRLIMISESEAAVLYAEKKTSQFNADDTMLVCEAGFYTINLALFKKSTFEGGTKSFQEVLDGRSIPFDSEQVINEYFIKYVTDVLDGFEYELEEEWAWKSLLKHLHYAVKPVILDNNDDENEVFDFLLSLPGAEIETDGFNLNEEGLVIESRLLRQHVFDPTIEKIMSMIEWQLNQVHDTELNYIILVGELGQTDYLRTKVEDRFSEYVGSICVPERGDRAVARGAVYHALDSH